MWLAVGTSAQLVAFAIRITSFIEGDGLSKKPFIHVLLRRGAALLAEVSLATCGLAAADVLTGSVQSWKLS